MEKTMKELCSWAGIPEKFAAELHKLDRDFCYESVQEERMGLLIPEKWETARARLREKLEPDERGMKILACMLRCMEESRRLYEEKGISEKIFIDTMGCFGRFVREHKASYGIYGFDRDFWVSRQLSLKLFRIGELEYEMTEREGACVISMHIPSDCVLTPENWKKSCELSRQFFQRFYPEWAGKSYVCSSWLLSPALLGLLGEESNILKFQKAFEIISWDKEEKEFLEWVFKRKDLPFEALAENTSLQRKMKALLLSGGKVGEAFGVLRDSATGDKHIYT
ncbi:MAG: acyltransferase domain-containing protein [Eubacteriales bacterium]|nr:acyltransferase domain-containing protein [Eubacteriales bacterium]